MDRTLEAVSSMVDVGPAGSLVRGWQSRDGSDWASSCSVSGRARTAILSLRVVILVLQLVIGKGQPLLVRRGIGWRAATLEQSRHGATKSLRVGDAGWFGGCCG